MSTLALILEALIALWKFPDAMSAFIKLISKAPEEKRQEILVQVNAWMEESASKDRPTWEGK